MPSPRQRSSDIDANPAFVKTSKGVSQKIVGVIDGQMSAPQNATPHRRVLPDEAFRVFFEKIKKYLKPDDLLKVQTAYAHAKKAHHLQNRLTGDPYITHPLAVADILADMQMDYQTLMAALLHDVIEDTGVDKNNLEQHFGTAVTELVDGVSKLKEFFASKAEAQAKNLQKIVAGAVKDIRVILIKFADRLHNMRTLGVMPEEARHRIAKETLNFYAPLAGHLGMEEMRIEFEDLGFQFLYPTRWSVIGKEVDKVRGNREEVLDKMYSAIEAEILATDIKASIIRREKHSYSIYEKLRKKKKEHFSLENLRKNKPFFKDLKDIFAFRIIVDKTDDCYRALGIVHNLYKPDAGSFKDYIAIPKANGYQSLHTCLFGPSKLRVEIQIRTYAMDRRANEGIANHWVYKSGDKQALVVQPKFQEFLEGIAELVDYTGDSDEFLKNLKKNLFPNEVYVLSAQNNQVLELSAGATPVDFAYALGANIGNKCVGCLIDEESAPLSTHLTDWQHVEIVTSENAHPKTEWLSFVATGKARFCIQNALKNLKRSDSIAFGRDGLQYALGTAGLGLENLTDAFKEYALKQFELPCFDELLYQIGVGDMISHTVVDVLIQYSDNNSDNKRGLRQKNRQIAPNAPVQIRGTEGIAVTYASCCHPIPGDTVIAHRQKYNGIHIHVAICQKARLLKAKGEQIDAVNWVEKTQAESAEFKVVLQVVKKYKKTSITALSNALTDAKASTMGIETEEHDADLATIRITAEVQNRTHLAAVIRKLRATEGVVNVQRQIPTGDVQGQNKITADHPTSS